jgi:fatty acid amide hydrolase 2
LNCVVDERFCEALEDAHRVDEFIQSGVKSVHDIEKDTPFLGVPFSTKDCLQVTGMTIECLVQIHYDTTNRPTF